MTAFAAACDDLPPLLISLFLRLSCAKSELYLAHHRRDLGSFGQQSGFVFWCVAISLLIDAYDTADAP